jgi:hypothetical protein
MEVKQCANIHFLIIIDCYMYPGEFNVKGFEVMEEMDVR